MFNQPSIRVNFTGKEYVSYLKFKKTKKPFFKNNKMKLYAIYFIILGVLGLVSLMLLAGLMFPPSSSGGLLDSYYTSAVLFLQSDTSWSGIGKFLLMMFAPFIMMAWLLHGVGFHLVK